jgi:DNA adenine methylase
VRVPHPIPYQGSKRHIAKYILSFFPYQIETLIEPFAGSVAVSLAAAGYGKASRFHLNDINQPLMALWHEIIHNPQEIADGYEKLWHEQKGKEREYYDFVRDAFNETKRPDYFLYVLARCVKASVRYNSKGEFNQSPDNRRKGRNPKQMRNDILASSHLLRGRTIITSKDYREVLESVTRGDLVYMDPPYQGVCGNRDPRYYSGVAFEELALVLEDLIRRKVSFLLSYDGRKGEKTYGKKLPAGLGLHRIEIRAGRSTQSTLLGGSDVTYESLYLSPGLVERLEYSPDRLVSSFSTQQEFHNTGLCEGNPYKAFGGRRHLSYSRRGGRPPRRHSRQWGDGETPLC